MSATARERSRGGNALHNMSAPPRMTITIRPLRGPRKAPEPAPDSFLPPSFLCFACVDLDALCGPMAPRRGREWRAARMRALAVLARRALGDGAAAVKDLRGRSGEQLEDELRESAARLDPVALGLPAFALVRRTVGQAGNVPRERDPARALALATRVTGQVFVGSRSPLVAGLAAVDTPYWFFAPWPQPKGRRS